MAAELLVCEQRGRHRYYKLADDEVAHALEAVALIAERRTHTAAWANPTRQRLRFARCCYGHLAGQLGVELFSQLLSKEWLAPVNDGYLLTARGKVGLDRLGFAEDGMDKAKPSTPTRVAHRCLDWMMVHQCGADREVTRLDHDGGLVRCQELENRQLWATWRTLVCLGIEGLIFERVQAATRVASTRTAWRGHHERCQRTRCPAGDREGGEIADVITVVVSENDSLNRSEVETGFDRALRHAAATINHDPAPVLNNGNTRSGPSRIRLFSLYRRANPFAQLFLRDQVLDLILE